MLKLGKRRVNRKAPGGYRELVERVDPACLVSSEVFVTAALTDPSLGGQIRRTFYTIAGLS